MYALSQMTNDHLYSTYKNVSDYIHDLLSDVNYLNRKMSVAKR